MNRGIEEIRSEYEHDDGRSPFQYEDVRILFQEIDRLESENNNYKTMHVHPAVPEVKHFKCVYEDAGKTLKHYEWIAKSGANIQTSSSALVQETFTSPIASVDLDTVSEKQNGEPEVDLP